MLWIRINWIRIRILGFGDRLKKIQLTIFYILFWSKIATWTYLSLGLLKGHPSYRRSLQPSKENIQRFQKWNSLPFFLFLWAGYPDFPAKLPSILLKFPPHTKQTPFATQCSKFKYDARNGEISYVLVNFSTSAKCHKKKMRWSWNKW